MNYNLSDIINYFQLVEKKFNLNISYHHPLCNSFLGDNVSIIKKYNSHCNQYCLHMDIATFCHCSESYINHTFKKAIGMSINQYINAKRMNEAKRLLKHTALPISQIAISVGFSEPNYFTNTFKKMFGISPSDYRKD